MNNKVTRYISRHVVCDGKDIGLAIVELTDDGNVNIKAFEHETCFTRWTDSEIEIDRRCNPLKIEFRTNQ